MRRRRFGDHAAFGCRIMVFRAIPRRPCFCFIIAKLKCVSCRSHKKVLFCSYALSTHSLIENLHTKGIIFGEALRIWVKKYKLNLPENHSKNTKIAITGCKFSNIFWGSMPPDPLELFLFLNQLQICSAEKNLPLKKRWKLWPPSFSKFLATPLVHSDCITACPFSIKKYAKMSVLLM